MYVVAHHHIIDPPTAFARGEHLIRGEGAPDGVRVLHFLPGRDGSMVTCLWEAPSIAAVRAYVDATLGEAAETRCYEVDAEQSFARPASAISDEATVAT